VESCGLTPSSAQHLDSIYILVPMPTGTHPANRVAD
jgi:hypothetical protein